MLVEHKKEPKVCDAYSLHPEDLGSALGNGIMGNSEAWVVILVVSAPSEGEVAF